MCGHRTKFWPMGYKLKCPGQLPGTFAELVLVVCPFGPLSSTLLYGGKVIAGAHLEP